MVSSEAGLDVWQAGLQSGLFQVDTATAVRHATQKEG